jgi:hypothetical protein
MASSTKQDRQQTRGSEGWSGRRCGGWAAIAATLLSTFVPMAQAQQQQINPGSATAGLPPEPPPNATLPLYMRPSGRDFRKTPLPFPNPIAPFRPSTIEPPNVFNSPRLADLVRGGKVERRPARPAPERVRAAWC